MERLNQAIQREAERRQHWGRANRKGRPDGSSLNPHSHSVGMPGEYAFEQWSGIPMNMEAKRGGDGGIDFWYPTIIGIIGLDVKTATHFPPWLMQPDDMINNWTIYVLARLVAKDHASLVGWAWGWDLWHAKDIGDHAGTGVVNYRLLPSRLNSMESLAKIRV